MKCIEKARNVGIENDCVLVLVYTAIGPEERLNNFSTMCAHVNKAFCSSLDSIKLTLNLSLSQSFALLRSGDNRIPLPNIKDNTGVILSVIFRFSRKSKITQI